MRTAALTTLFGVVSISRDAFSQTPSPTVTPDTLEIINKVNSFYAGSFSNLLTLTLAILGFSGVLLPIILQIIQTRTLRVEQKALQSQIAADVGAAKATLQAELESLFTKEREDLLKTIKQETDLLNTRFSEQLAGARGKSFFLQAVGYQEKGHDAAAAADFAYAAVQMFEGKEESNAQRAIRRLLTSMPKVDRTDFEVEGTLLKENLDELVKTLEANNTNDRYGDTISDVKQAVKSAMARQPLPAASPRPTS